MASVHKDSARDYESYNSSILENPETKNAKKVTYLYEPTRRLDRDVLQERSELISHSAYRFNYLGKSALTLPIGSNPPSSTFEDPTLTR